MRRILLVGAILAVAPISASGHAGRDMGTLGKSITLKGEVVDLGCYLEHPKTATGEGHKECATKCLSKGMPAALRTEKGALYLLLLDHTHMDALGAARSMPAEIVEITGAQVQYQGMRALQVSEVRKVAAAR